MKNLTQKLLNILETLGGVPKKGYNKAQNYYYTREVDVLEALKEALISNKVILLTSSKLIETHKKDRTDKYGNITQDFYSVVETTHRFIDSESSDELTISSVGGGLDSSDKSIPKSITSSVKYALMKTFLISEEGADVENDGESPQPPVFKPAIPKASAPVIGVKSEDLKSPETKNTPQTFGVKTASVKTEAPKTISKFGAKKKEPSFP